MLNGAAGRAHRYPCCFLPVCAKFNHMLRCLKYTMWPFICVIKGEKHQTDRMKSVYVLVFHVCAKAFKADLDLLDLFAGRAERTPARLQDLTHTHPTNPSLKLTPMFACSSLAPISITPHLQTSRFIGRRSATSRFHIRSECFAKATCLCACVINRAVSKHTPSKCAIRKKRAVLGHATIMIVSLQL